MNTIERPSDRLTESENVFVILASHAHEIRSLGKRALADIVEIGRHLQDAHELLVGPRGKHAQISWPEWLRREFRWSDRAAANFMNVHRLVSSEKFSDKELGNIPVSALYLLGAPSLSYLATIPAKSPGLAIQIWWQPSVIWRP